MRKLGKPNRELMASSILKLTGARPRKVLVGPTPGIDVSVLEVGPEKVMILSTDPISLIPGLGVEKSAWLSVHAVASDLATSGVQPEFAVFDLNLPPSLTDLRLRRYWRAIHHTCKELGVAILGGHTGRFEGCDFTVVGGATFIAFTRPGRYVTSDMAKEGDELIATKSAAIEASAVLATSFPNTVRRRAGARALSAGLKLLKQVSVVQDALMASSVGLGSNGVSAMHDVTEGGIISAVLELANASKLKAELDQDAIPIADEVRKICQAFGIDPLISLGQGCLIIAAGTNRSGRIISALQGRGIPACVIGRLTRDGHHTISGSNGSRRLSYPKGDPYWEAYGRGVREHLT